MSTSAHLRLWLEKTTNNKMQTPDIALNKTSFSHHPAPSQQAAQDAFGNFVLTIGALIDEGVCRSVVRSEVCLQDIAIPTEGGDEWKVHNWLIDKNVDHDLRSFILALDTKIPIEEGLILNSEAEEDLINNEYRAGAQDGPICYTAGLALHTGSVVVSLATHSIWDTSQLSVFVINEATPTQKETVDHASHESHAKILFELYKSRHFLSIKSPSDFSTTKANLFPNLRFSPDVDDQVEKLEPPYFFNALAKLLKMNETALRWAETKSLIPDYKFQWSNESPSTMDYYGKDRQFRAPGGGTAIFEKHIYFSRRHRIHFIEDRTSRDFVVGYIGDHLPTVKYPH